MSRAPVPPDPISAPQPSQPRPRPRSQPPDPRALSAVPMARPVEEMPTLMLAGHGEPGGRGANRSGGGHDSGSGGARRPLRTLRWRLALIYAGVLALVLLVLGLVLNTAISRVLYLEDSARLVDEATAAVTIGQRAYERALDGRGTTCAGAVSYQQAFDQSFATQLKGHPAISAVYLLDRNGSVLAPEDGAVAATSPAPYVRAGQILTMDALIARHPQAALGPVPDAVMHYDTQDGNGSRIGVILIGERFRTVPTCSGPSAAATATGIVEVVTTYATTRAALARIQLLLLIVLLAALLVGIAVGAPLIAGALRPLGRVTAAARRIARGDLTQRVRLPHGGDEIGELAEAFDEMAARIEYAFAAQHASEERMRQFIADASHELRTPLTSIRGYTDVLLRGAAQDPATAAQVLGQVRREAERMSRLVNDLLTLARLDDGRPLELQPVDLAALAGEAVDQARISAGEREVALRNEAGYVRVLADPDRLKQVLLILLDNALKYGRQDAGGWVRMRIGRAERGVFVSVSDNGPGIAAEDLPHIFDRFYRAQRAALRRMTGAFAAARTTGEAADSRAVTVVPPSEGRGPEGSGLGLPIALALARAHGGTLTAESQPSAGTTFRLEVPLPPDE
ncbi:MAG TPA: HAMP domain-containing sensor histidine kinase [Ktedonobacterales bacterium]